jgi:DNA-binding SARP family transcriptional activator
MALTTVVYDADSDADADQVWHVDDNGNVLLPAPSGAQRRLCVLTATTAADLLTLIGQAHGLDAAPDADTATPRPLATVPPTTVTDRPVRLTVLGELSLTVNDQPVGIRRTAGWQILVLLAAHPEGLTGRDIITAVWPGPPPATITNRLYSTLSDLRTYLRPRLHADGLIVHRGHRYALDPHLVDVDLWHLRTAAHAAATAITTTDRRRAHHDVITHHGELAAGQTWPWLEPHRETIRHHVVDAYADLADSIPAAEAIELLRHAIAVDPYNEHLHHRAVDALIDLGDHTAATRLHDTYLQRLTTAGMQPGSDTRDLANRTSRR